jgi:hypothetical protein
MFRNGWLSDDRDFEITEVRYRRLRSVRFNLNVGTWMCRIATLSCSVGFGSREL